MIVVYKSQHCIWKLTFYFWLDRQHTCNQMHVHVWTLIRMVAFKLNSLKPIIKPILCQWDHLWLHEKLYIYLIIFIRIMRCRNQVTRLKSLNFALLAQYRPGENPYNDPAIGFCPVWHPWNKWKANIIYMIQTYSSLYVWVLSLQRPSPLTWPQINVTTTVVPLLSGLG